MKILKSAFCILSLLTLCTWQCKRIDKDNKNAATTKVIILPDDIVVSKQVCKPGLSYLVVGNQELVIRWKEILYRQIGDSTAMHTCPIRFNELHALAYNPWDSTFYGVDSGDSSIVTFSSLTDHTILNKTKQLAGINLVRPHDILVDESNGWLYVIDAVTGNLFRMKGIGKQESRLAIPSKDSSYFRSISLVENKIYATISSEGRVVEIEDFDSTKIRFYQSFGKKTNKRFGSWESTGMALNDIEFFDGYWYITNSFMKQYAPRASNIETNKFVRFKSFENFALGEWEDITPVLDSALVPYYMTRFGDALYVATYPGEDWPVTCVYKITSQH